MLYTCKPTKMSVYHNIYGKMPEKIKRETGCTTLFNGVWFNPDGTLCLDNRIAGKTISDEPGYCMGFGWNGDGLPVMDHSGHMENFDNFISCVCAVAGGTKQILNDNEYYGGTRGRTAFGMKADGTLVVLVTSDTNGAMTLTAARDKLYNLGCRDALLLDGGGSCYLNCPTGIVDTTIARKTANRTYICVWEDVPEKRFKVCLDPGHGTAELNCSPDKSYYEYQFAWDVSNRIKDLLEQTERFDVILTKSNAEETPALSTRAAKANSFGADIYVATHSNAVPGGWKDKIHGLTAWIYAVGGKRQELAQHILDQMAAQGVELFGNKLYTDNFTVLGKTNMPAVLIENYFHTCHDDVSKLLNDDERDKLAYATACGICEYFNLGADLIPLTEEEEKTEAEVKADIVFRVQTGAFSDESNAEAMAKKLQAQGYKTIIKEEKK